MPDGHLNTSLVEVDCECISNAELIIEAQDSLAWIDEIPGVLPDMKAD